MNYIMTSRPERTPQLLAIHWQRRRYDFLIQHLSLNERRSGRGGLFPHEHTHDIYHAVLYTEGQNTFGLKGGRVPCERGTLVLTSPGTPHDFGAGGKGVVSYDELTFSLEAGETPLRLPFHELLSLYSGEPVPPLDTPMRVEEWRTRQLSALLTDLLDVLIRRKSAGAFGVAAIVSQLFVTLVDIARGNCVRTAVEEDAGLFKAKEIVETRFSQRLTLKELASTCNISPAYFCRRYKAAFGIAPVANLVRARIEAAKVLLRTTSLTCKEVAEQVGFRDHVFFSKMFKRRCEETPDAFRRRRRGE